MKNKIASIPRIPKNILRAILPSDNPFVVEVDAMIGKLNVLSENLPLQYGWRFRTSDAFASEFRDIQENITDCILINEFYWRDQLGNWEAYAFMNALRVIDLARSCIWALARQDFICAALLSRSALETVAAFLDASRTFDATMRQPSNLLNPKLNLRENIVISTELEELSLKIIFASKLSESEKIYNPTNILTILNRITKMKDQKFIISDYSVLCEVAHPNLLGRAIYLQAAEPGSWEGNELRTLARGNGIAWRPIALSTVAALSWSCGAQVSAFALIANTIGGAMQRFGAATTLTA